MESLFAQRAAKRAAQGPVVRPKFNENIIVPKELAQDVADFIQSKAGEVHDIENEQGAATVFAIQSETDGKSTCFAWEGGKSSKYPGKVKFSLAGSWMSMVPEIKAHFNL